jgi:hypothetical protein
MSSPSISVEGQVMNQAEAVVEEGVDLGEADHLVGEEEAAQVGRRVRDSAA